MVNFKHVSELIPPHSGLQVCISDSNPIQVLQWQCQGEPTADLVRGVYTTNPLHINKAINFVRLAKETCSDLVLTPEYSFPCEVLDNVVGDHELWPERGSLWCLCMQGYARQEFAEKLEQWTSTDTLVIRNAFERILRRHFVDALIYLFILDDGRLCILPQLKTTPMSERWNDHEVRGLCTSDLIYIFDLYGNSDDQNRFLSILCSDALCIKAQDILDYTIGKYLTIFHAQLNPEPRHSDFRSFRSSFFDRNAGRDIRLLTLNWAEGTKIDDQVFSKPWSAFYKKSYRGEVPEQQLRAWNHDRGTYYALHHYTEIWYSDREEHCKRFDINKGFQLGVSYPVITHNEPITQEYYLYSVAESSWKHVLKEDHLPALIELIDSHGSDYDFPLVASPHDSDAFFGLCFGHFLEGELNAEDNELVTRLFSGSDQESDQRRNAKANQYKKLIQLIKKQEFPPS
ncbi:hypothetical protein [Desulfosporosinus sp. SB140]|uniref:hypothetical protein n=1 Tax=Desulfosporosinus paludis TaxID=3115649 RepID=UPI00388EFED9